MLDKNFLQSFLKLNNASETMSDGEVKTVLSRAGWAQTEIEAAIALLRSGAGSMVGTSQLAGAGTTAAMSPVVEFSSQQLSSLLGVDVEVDPHSMRRGQSYHARRSGGSPHDVFITAMISAAVIVFSIALTVALGWLFMYFFEVGPYRS